MAETTSAAPAVTPPASAPRPASALGQFGWAMFDGARAPYNTLVNIFVFSAYFSTVVITDSAHGQAMWSWITATAAFCVAVGAPILGAIADAGGRRKPWLAATVIWGAPCMLVTWLAVPGMALPIWIIVVVGLVGATLSFEYSAVFCNAMLPNVTARHRIGFLSGLGLTLGNCSTILLFAFFLAAWSWNPHPLFGLDIAAHEPERAVGLLAAIWFAVFALPLFLFTPDSPDTKRSAGEAIRHGLSNLAQTFVKVRRYANVAKYLVARMIFNEGFIVLILFTGVFAAGILKWTATMLIVEGLINSVVAAIAGLFGGWLDTKIGSKKATMVFVAGCLLMNIILTSVSTHSIFFVELSPAALVPDGSLFPTLPDKVFLITQCFVAFFVTGAIATTRALMAKISPPEMLNEFFGLFAFSGTATSFIGPLAIGILTELFHNQRAGVAVGVFFLGLGLALMLLVKEEPDDAPAH